MESLPLFHRLNGAPVVVVGEGEAAEAKRRLVRNAGGTPAPADAPGARLAFVALDAPEATVAALRARGLLVNCVDRPDLCDFTVPALVDRAPVLVAVGTGGASAGLAKAVRLRLERLLPPRLGDLARALFAARPAQRERFADAGERRRALDLALAEGGMLDPFDPASAERLADWLAGAAAPAGGVIALSLASPDPDELTLRQARLLGMADRVLHSADVPPAILARARADAARGPLGDQPVAAAGELVLVLTMA
jgi:uroporphyrin-III C-methyltransferase/precorrin-2 dehydrogenase/sirohydrochlorin ferrochelatase